MNLLKFFALIKLVFVLQISRILIVLKNNKNMFINHECFTVAKISQNELFFM